MKNIYINETNRTFGQSVAKQFEIHIDYAQLVNTIYIFMTCVETICKIHNTSEYLILALTVYSRKIILVIYAAVYLF